MDHADDRSVEVRAVAAAFMSVAVVTVILRCYVRGWLVKAFGWDDGAMVVALVRAGRLQLPRKKGKMKPSKWLTKRTKQ